MLFVVCRRSLFVGSCIFFVVWGVVLVVCLLLCVVCSVFVVWCLLIVVCCLLCVVCCFVICSFLL